MKPAAVLLVDLENFVLSRFDYFNDESIRPEDRPSFAEDIRNLARCAQKMAALPLAVRRAYADYDTLTVDPQDLMRQGVEPVQVFRLSGRTGNKNASDMKLALDALALIDAGPHIEHVVLVSGDGDFIPVILELKRRGLTVSVIAVSGATNELIRRFVDHFALFEELVPIDPAKLRPRAVAPTADDLQQVAAAARKVLVRTRPLRASALAAQLPKELAQPLDWAAFGCSGPGEFVRRHAAALGLVTRGGHGDPEVDFAPALPSTGSRGARNPARSTALTAPAPKPPAHEPHSPEHYRHLLASGRTDAHEARVLTVPWDALAWVCEAVIPALTPPTGGPATSAELMKRLQDAARATEAPDLAAHVSLIHSAVRCALPEPSPEGLYTLAPETTGEGVRLRLLRHVVSVLGCRVAESGVGGPIRAAALASAFDPGPALEQATAEIAAVLAEAAEPAPAGAKSVPRPEDVHTAAGYRKLFQCGGPRGSGETEHLRVNPPPWPSVERACADAFAALHPSAGGCGQLNRGQFLERLYAAEKEVPIENYRGHARRAFNLLKMSGAAIEDEDRVALHPEVDAADAVRWAVLGALLNLIAIRLDEKGLPGPVRAGAFCEALEAGPLTAELEPQIARAIACMYEEAEADTLPPEPPADAAPEPVAGAAEAAEPPATAVLSVEIVEVELTPAPLPRDPNPDLLAFDPESTPAQEPTADDLNEPSGVIDMVALTSEAVANSAEPVAAVLSEPPAGPPEEPPAEPAADGPAETLGALCGTDIPPCADPEREGAQTFLSVPQGREPEPPAPGADAAETVADAPAADLPPGPPAAGDEFPMAIPIDDWLPDLADAPGSVTKMTAPPLPPPESA